MIGKIFLKEAEEIDFVIELLCAFSLTDRAKIEDDDGYIIGFRAPTYPMMGTDPNAVDLFRDHNGRAIGQLLCTNLPPNRNRPDYAVIEVAGLYIWTGKFTVAAGMLIDNDAGSFRLVRLDELAAFGLKTAND